MKSKKILFWSVALFAAFIMWTALLCFVDVETIGPQGSKVGLAHLNRHFHALTGVNMTLYTVTDWLGIIPIAVAFAFAAFGISQWIKRKRLLAVDHSLFALGIFYVAVMAAYVFFEVVSLNYRPILIEGRLEASYPSSTTMLVMCVMPTAIMQLIDRMQNKVLKGLTVTISVAFIIFMVVGRLLSGVHWVSDIIGGALLSAALVLAYRFASENM